MSEVNALTARLEGPSPAMEIAKDMLRRAVIWAPLAILASAAVRGTDGAASATVALVIVSVNFLLAAWLLQTGARISIALMAGAALFGYLLRLALILVAVLLLKDQPWLDPVTFGIVLIVTHLGLLFWELRYVSGSMAFPGLRPQPGLADTTDTAPRVVDVSTPSPDRSLQV